MSNGGGPLESGPQDHRGARPAEDATEACGGQPMHWLAEAPAGRPSSGPAVAFSAEMAQSYRDIGWEVTGPYVLAEGGSDVPS